MNELEGKCWNKGERLKQPPIVVVEEQLGGS
jgi:hypothetical protein